MTLLFLDTECTGVEDEDRLLQVAFIQSQTREKCDVVNELFKPPVPIKLPAMAVHHVTEKMVADKPVFKDSSTYKRLAELLPNSYLIAHNAKYDVGMLNKEGLEVPKVICTYKLAKYLDDGQFENHQMQYLRYYYGIELDATAHDALGDIMVLEQLFHKLALELEKKDFKGDQNFLDEIIDRMVEISKLPSLVKKFSFGKYNGKTIAEVANNDKGYLQWLLDQKKQNPKNEEDWIYTLNYYLNK